MVFDPLQLLFLLLPVAAWTGYRLGRRGSAGAYSDLSPDYYRGLNYLLNEQPDKAIEVFVRMMELDSETVETHFALGNLFRRRGEVDRAIRIHQNLIARPTLTPTHREQALFELGIDYMRAGLLDRAENLFLELINDTAYSRQALRQLLDVYQRERDWQKAIQTAQRLASLKEERLAAEIAQFHCELAEAELDLDNPVAAVKPLRQALAEDSRCVRASLLEARMELAQGSPRAAVRALKRVATQDPDYLPEALEPLRQAYDALGRQDEYLEYLAQLMNGHDGISVVLAYAELLRASRGDGEAIAVITEYLQQRPSVRGLERLIELKLRLTGEELRGDLEVLRELTDRLLRDKPVYKCERCGFTAKSLHWQCPTCRHWNSIKPIHGVEGE